jgi:chitosanase
MSRLAVLLAWVSLAAACAEESFAPAPACEGDAALDADRKRRAEQLTSLFENDTVEIQYGYAEALDDGRGITAGRAGFTSGTGDMLQVVADYTARVPGNPLATYLPRLEELAAQESGAVDGLEGLEAAWQGLADDAEFRAAQDAVSDELYYQPAVRNAEEIGLCLPLSVAAIYDAIIQHGEGDDPDGLDALVNRTNDREGGSVADGVEEGRWLRSFLAVRRDDLAHANDPETREVWAESVARVDVFRELADAENWTLQGPIEIDDDEYTATIE